MQSGAHTTRGISRPPGTAWGGGKSEKPLKALELGRGWGAGPEQQGSERRACGPGMAEDGILREGRVQAEH